MYYSAQAQAGAGLPMDRVLVPGETGLLLVFSELKARGPASGGLNLKPGGAAARLSSNSESESGSSYYCQY